MKVLEITPCGCADLFSEFGEATDNDRLLERSPDDIRLVVFTGGEDVWPEIYGENALWCTHYNSQRDLYEGRMFELACRHRIPMVGICRGAQFLCVKAGGKLIQDIGGHLVSHEVETNDGRVFVVNSAHHQMQLPPEDATPLAWSRNRRSNRYLNGDGDRVDVDREYEVVYYPSIRAIGVQYHPEWLAPQDAAVNYVKEIVRRYLIRRESA